MWTRLKKYRPDWLTLVLLGLIGYVWFRPPAWVSDENHAAPQMQATLLDGRPFRLEQLRGKVVLVNFWATWCPYCRHEMPAMERFYRDYRGRGFEILALSQDDAPDAVRQFLAREGYHFPAAMAEAGQAAALGGVSRLPTSFIIDKQGRVRYKISGQLHYARLEGLVGPLLEER
ncbi:MAG: TlpA family protein disulfide reductase [Betaproteobacteria bacterium]